ncbi:MAG: insulinase family protein [Lachnospirales bacterium]
MFTLDKKEYIDDISSTGYIYTHHSGGKLVFIENDDENRVFSIAFRTMPENNKGTAHIVEHCVLCGSENFSIKDPFNILDKGSIHTYLNAMTYTDKTVYPIGSTNEKDFKAMMRVYCDAVFRPLMYKNEGIFRQEGWHSNGSELNGVVLNEMKGVYSESSVRLESAIIKKLFKDTPYSYDSGGKPEDIPDLAYEEFLAFHKKNYHPSNAIIYIYGKININEYMEILDKEFIGEYDFKENKFEAPVFKPDYSDTILFEPAADKNVLQAIYYTGDVLDFSKCLMFDILCDLFFNIEGAYIKNQIKDLGEQVSASFSDSSYFTNFNIEISGSEQINLNEFKIKLNEAFKTAVVDEYKLQGVINSYKFYFKEEDFGYKPRGLFYNTLLLRSFIYNNYSFEPLRINKLFEDIKTIDIKELINNYFINKGCYGILVNTPKEETTPKIPKKNNECVEKYQSQEDNPEEIAKINISKVYDIPKDPRIIDYKVYDNNLFIPNKNDVTYIDIMFDTSVIPKKYLPTLGIWQSIIDNYSIEYSNDIDYYLGGFNTALKTIPHKNTYHPYMTIKIKVLNENIDKSIDLFKKVIAQSADNFERLEELVNEHKQLIISRYISAGHIKGYVKSLAAISEEYNYADLVAGTGLYNYIINTDLEQIQQDINYIITLLFNKKGVTYCVCGNNFIKEDILLNELESFEAKHYKYGLGKEESIAVKSNINYNTMSFLMECKHGSYRVLQQMLTREYMWDKIRLEGGAYGGGCRFIDGRRCYMYSYRDPQLEKTYEVFKNIGNYAQTLKSQSDIDRFILGAINEADAPLKNNVLNSLVFRRHITEVKEEYLYRRRYELLSTTPEDIVKIGEKINNHILKSSLCTIGKKEDIEKNINLLGSYFEM